ncbi:MAG: LytTR family transcriptional regulator DNA-binding domain-containing protein, partial [Lachnospiraceae bacterium]|nr:LytTR family transcriptional regulator DNA-binding domain-containing protein [Lachnospiraceae bacterium]
TDYVLDGYSVRALQYLIKPVDNKILREVLEYELKSKNNVSVVFKEKDSTRKVPASDIVHIETSGRNVKVVLKDEEFNAYNKISDVEKMLPAKDFIRCHQSFIININNIKEIRHGEAVSVLETVVPVSRTQWSKVKRLFVDRH